MKHDSHLRSALEILDYYNGAFPLSAFLKSFFWLRKQVGSRDRRSISSLVYNYFRLGHSLKNIPKEERIFAGLFLCESNPCEPLQYFRPGLNELITRPLTEKLSVIQDQFPGFQWEDIFPWKEELSGGIDHKGFCLSFLRQPKLFIRVRLDKKEAVMGKLLQAGISAEIMNDSCLALPNGTKVENIIDEKSWYVIQDYSSQRTAGYFQFPALQSAASLPPARAAHRSPLIWDCCAGSGGKSILLHDLYPGARLFASDIRRSIIRNLEKRFSEAGIRNYACATGDLTNTADAGLLTDKVLQAGMLSGIIADVPCSGSGTWSRTPEQLYFFQPGKINEFRELQRNIIRNIIPCLSKGTPLIYITCSVFRKENEERIGDLQAAYGLCPERSGMLPGYERGADTMFAARLMP